MAKPYVTKFRDRIRNAISAFKGKPFESLYFGIDIKRCDKCDSHFSNVYYLCDRKACNGGCNNPACMHTNDILHAKNFNGLSLKGPQTYWENKQ